jgi:hypothetical protein
VQDELIASLRREIQAQKAMAAEGKDSHAQLAVVNAENTRLVSENKALSKSLIEAQNENKALSAKLRAAQLSSQRAESVGPRLPGSAAKAPAARPVLLGTSDAAKEAQRNQLKEELYRDLTGLVILGVKCNDEENVYDCIQTGRNGSESKLTSRHGIGECFAKRSSSFTFPFVNGRSGQQRQTPCNLRRFSLRVHSVD